MFGNLTNSLIDNLLCFCFRSKMSVVNFGQKLYQKRTKYQMIVSLICKVLLRNGICNFSERLRYESLRYLKSFRGNHKNIKFNKTEGCLTNLEVYQTVQFKDRCSEKDVKYSSETLFTASIFSKKLVCKSFSKIEIEQKI